MDRPGPNLKPDEEFLRLLPLMSGYRDEATQRVHFNLQYPKEEWDDPASTLEADDFVVVLPVSEVRSARLFDLDVYSRHFANAPDEDPPAEASPASPT